MVCRWNSMFSERKESVHYDERKGRPATSWQSDTIDVLHTVSDMRGTTLASHCYIKS